MNPPHTITIPTLAAYILTSAVESNGWAKTTRELKCAFELLGLLDELHLDRTISPAIKATRTQRAAIAENAEWCLAPLSLSLTDAQHATARKCLTVLCESGNLPPGAMTSALLDAFAVE